LKKVQQLIIGIVLFIPFLYLSAWVSLVGYLFEGVLLNWLFIVIAAGISLPSLLSIDRHIKHPSKQQLNQPLKARYFYIAVIWAIFSVVLTLTLNNLAFLPAPIDNVLQSSTAKILAGPLRWPMIISLCFLTPICEELGFRGVMQNYLSNIFGYWPSILITSLIFVFLHGYEIVASLCLFISTIGFSLFNRASGTMKTSIVSHMTYNIIVTILIVLQL
jgi:uncharacterized protein